MAANAPISSLEDARVIRTIASAPLVLIGEASHGTHEFYAQRAEITKRLISDYGFTAVCIEGDWPDAYRVNRYVRGADDDASARDSLGGFTRFPAWMWRNTVVLDFVGWLRDYNDGCAARGRPKAGFYGLDLYSMYASIEAVLSYLDRIDPQAAARARRRYECLEPFERHPERYGLATELGLQPSCREDVLAQLLEIQRQASSYAKLDGRVAEDQYFYAEQNARIVANAEEYYRAMIDERVSTWNLRDTHMVDTLERLMGYLSTRQGGPTRAVVWAHNSHVGDATATSMGKQGETNVGALVRARHGRDCMLLGLTTYDGTVTAASDWHAPEDRKRVRPAREDSYEHFFHGLGRPEFFLSLRDAAGLAGLPRQARERAIGVIYRPDTELQSHYFYAEIARQFDAVMHFDRTRALEPLDRTSRWETGEPPETFPSGV